MNCSRCPGEIWRRFFLAAILILAAAGGCGRRKPPPATIRFAPGEWLAKLGEDPLPMLTDVRPNITVVAVANRGEADVLILDSFDFSEAIHRKELFNLLPRMEEEFFDLRQFKDADIRHAGRTDGFYGLPVGGGGPAVVYFNVDLFKRENVPPPDQEWEWADFLDAAKKLTRDLDNDGKPDQFGFLVEPKIEALLPWLWQGAGTIATFDDPKAVKGIEFYADLVRRHKVSPAPADGVNLSPIELFTEQRLAMFLGGPEWAEKLESVDFQWSIQTPPKGPAGPATTAHQFFCAVNKNTEHPDEAWELVKFLSSSYVGMAVVRSGLLPARTELLEIFEFPEEDTLRNRTVWARAFDMARHVPFVLACDEREDKLVPQELRKLLEGKASAEETARAIAQRCADLHRKLE